MFSFVDFHIVGGKEDVPASPDDERLVDGKSVRFAFLQNAFFACLSGLVTYFVVFNHYGIPPSALYRAVPDAFPATGDQPFVVGGRSYSPDRQEEILNSVQSAYYFSVAINQVLHSPAPSA